MPAPHWEALVERKPRRTVVLGLGNDILTDDAVGLKVACAVEQLLRVDSVPNVDVLLSTRAGFELIDLLTGYEQGIIIDAFDCEYPTPGSVHTLSLDDFAGCARLTGGHEVSLAQAFRLAEQLGAPMPGLVEVYAVEVLDLQTIGEKLTPRVAHAVNPLAFQIHSRLKELSKGNVLAADSDCDNVEARQACTDRAFYPPTGPA